jgi:hypothetical protein
VAAPCATAPHRRRAVAKDVNSDSDSCLWNRNRLMMIEYCGYDKVDATIEE